MPEQPIYKRPELSLAMSDLIARQGVAEAVEIIFVDDNVYYVDFERPELPDQAA
jgi:hypothetical protein